MVFNFVGEEICHFVDKPVMIKGLLQDVHYPRLDTGKKLIQIREHNLPAIQPANSANAVKALTLIFQDGTEAKVDAVIGCDGTFSHVRDSILREWANEYRAKPAPFWWAENSNPVNISLPDVREADQSFYVGDGGVLGLYVVPRLGIAKCTMAACMRGAASGRELAIDRDFLWSHFYEWSENFIARNAVEVNETIICSPPISLSISPTLTLTISYFSPCPFPIPITTSQYNFTVPLPIFITIPSPCPLPC